MVTPTGALDGVLVLELSRLTRRDARVRPSTIAAIGTSYYC
jgi:hypothetical protein